MEASDTYSLSAVHRTAGAFQQTFWGDSDLPRAMAKALLASPDFHSIKLTVTNEIEVPVHV